MNPLELEAHRLDRYQHFANRYQVQDFVQLVSLYEIDDLESFLPPQPNPFEQKVFNQLIGTLGETGYLDYEKSNHTFELIMSWQELTGNHANNAISFRKEGPKA